MNVTAFWANFSKVAKTMTNSAEQPAKLKSHETRHRNTERRIRQAMDRLVAQASLEGRTTRVTVAALAREAQVSRNTIYAEHSSFLEELASANPPRPGTQRPPPKSDMSALRASMHELQAQRRLLATENASLLKRVLDAEKAVARLEKQNAKLVQEISRVRRLSST